MSRITLNTDLLAKLPSLKNQTTIVDENGKPLGFYTPIDYDKLFAEFSEEDLNRIEQANEWVTTEELLAYLEKR